ncbi:MAG: hypothetical protein A2V77_02075 [Anaeromyxobacter sp. RBG_16_69_14]|nr:MAG: hypothetical protein A2V77_02075 [Anaeromyxobacter sp. RBG_16_69_14]
MKLAVIGPQSREAERVRTLAGQLAASGIGSDDRVLLALPNTPATAVAGLALNTPTVEANREWGTEVPAAIVVGRPGHRPRDDELPPLPGTDAVLEGTGEVHMGGGATPERRREVAHSGDQLM